MRLKQTPNCESFGAAGMFAGIAGGLEVLKRLVLFEVALICKDFVADFALDFVRFGFWFLMTRWVWLTEGFEGIAGLLEEKLGKLELDG